LRELAQRRRRRRHLQDVARQPRLALALDELRDAWWPVPHNGSRTAILIDNADGTGVEHRAGGLFAII
jgi:hypothetical protein